MEVHFTSDQETQLQQLAARTGRETDELVQEAVGHMLHYNDWFRDQVRIGLEQLDRGEFVEDEEVRLHIERTFGS